MRLPYFGQNLFGAIDPGRGAGKVNWDETNVQDDAANYGWTDRHFVDTTMLRVVGVWSPYYCSNGL